MKQRVMLFQTARQGLSRVLETAECGKLGLDGNHLFRARLSDCFGRGTRYGSHLMLSIGRGPRCSRRTQLIGSPGRAAPSPSGIRPASART